MKSNCVHLAIVGGGAAGVAIFIAAVKQCIADVIYVIEPKTIGPGIAFSNLDKDVLCNTSADIMSIVYDRPDDFMAYLNECGLDATKDSFVSRALVGKYLNSRFCYYLNIAEKKGIQVYHITEEFKSLKIRGYCQYSINFTSKITPAINVTDVVFCTGYGSPRLPDLLYPFRGADSFICCPYPEKDMLDRVKNRKRILVIGSKLSAIDSAILLGREGHRVTMLSPSGELASVRSRFIRDNNKNININELTKIISGWRTKNDNVINWGSKHALLRFVLRTISSTSSMSWKSQFSFVNNYKDLIRGEILIAEKGDCLWQDFIVEFVDAINDYYISNEPDEIPPEIMKIIYRYATGIALPNAKKILKLIDDEHLIIRKGKLNHVHYDSLWHTEWGQGTEVFDAIVLSAGFYLPYFIFNQNGELEIDTEEESKTNHINITEAMSISHPCCNENESIWFVGPPAHIRIPIPNSMFIIVRSTERVIQNIRSHIVTRRGS